jgi:hypothetical protein
MARLHQRGLWRTAEIREIGDHLLCAVYSRCSGVLGMKAPPWNNIDFWNAISHVVRQTGPASSPYVGAAVIRH